MNWEGLTVVVTGAFGFVGRNLVPRLQNLGARVFGYGRKSLDCNDLRLVEDAFKLLRPDVVFHLAGEVGGIGDNKFRQADFLVNNLCPAINVFIAAKSQGIKKIVILGSSCMYPLECHNPIKENSLWNGIPESTNRGYAVSKLTEMELGMAYSRQYGLQVINMISANLYGPHDHFGVETNHVIPAMIEKIYRAKEYGSPSLLFWGSGKPVRDFLYVDDCMDALVSAPGVLSDPQPVNIGRGVGVSIDFLANEISGLIGYEGRIGFDNSHPDGHPQRVLDISLAKEKIGFEPKTSLRDGLKKTIEWYRENILKKEELNA